MKEGNLFFQPPVSLSHSLSLSGKLLIFFFLLLTTMPSIPKNTSLYEILQLEKTATSKEIKSQYRKLALKFHPDKQSASCTEQEKQAATEQFQQLGLAYSILSDPAKKSHYDLTGNISQDDSLKGDKSWNDYFKELWDGVVNKETIEKFAAEYKGSEEERKDVLKRYEECKGDMDNILTFIECSNAKDGERFTKMIQKAIDEGQVVLYPSFYKTTTTKAHQIRIKKEEQNEKKWEANEKKKKKKQKANDDDDISSDGLLAMIKARQKDRAARLDALADKIAEKEGLNNNQQEYDGPSEDEFQRIQAEMLSKRKRSGDASPSSSKKKKGGDGSDEDKPSSSKRAKKNNRKPSTK
ncbi:hypothetical protein BDA99DRAFT_526369 [Phascolomyces articulosus]|uniref:J domain-containing protein n=1 Tax=Phascolomyces articulosus TaxID=60185 RepID=A0AAD5P894_9FUNG|nr:hypothetical protein BDA99DRAFT_526369 [Phascolomyces articulosus]